MLDIEAHRRRHLLDSIFLLTDTAAPFPQRRAAWPRVLPRKHDPRDPLFVSGLFPTVRIDSHLRYGETTGAPIAHPRLGCNTNRVSDVSHLCGTATDLLEL